VSATDDLASSLPKVELHVHIEGTLEPEMMFEIGMRNGIHLPFADVAAVRAAYRFLSLQSFLDIYYRGAEVLRTRRDFYDLMLAYLRRASADGVRHAEIFFDPQTHTARGVGFDVFMSGFGEAMADARAELGITADLIMCFLRHLSGEEATATLREAEPHLEGIIGVGLDSTEVDRPARLFEEIFSIARSLGLRTVAHAGEEGPPQYVVDALDLLGAERIDHGVRSMEDPELVARLVRDRVPLTVCPISNVALRVVPDLAAHPLRAMMDAGLLVSVNSDDPAFFGGYIGENFRRVGSEAGIDTRGLVDLAQNSIESSFLDQNRKQSLIDELAAVSVGDQG
jgi:adenine deaminase